MLFSRRRPVLRPGLKSLPAAMILIFLGACSGAVPGRVAAPEQPPPEVTAQPTPSVAEVAALSLAQRTTLGREAVQRKLKNGDPLGALQRIRLEVAKGVPEKALTEEYGRTLEALLDRAEGALEEERFEEAGKLFRAARDGFPRTKETAGKVRSATGEIEARIGECAAALMERGLLAYRRGALDEAIELWRTIHAFAPRHQASRQALQTAEVQRENLEKAVQN